MPKAVLDTNVLVSALITPLGTPAQIIRAWRAGAFDLVTSPYLIEELRETLSRPKIAHSYRLSLVDVHDLLALIAGAALLVTGTADLPAAPRDPDDIPVLACAVAGQVEYLVTGDADLLSLRACKGVQVVRPSTFFRILRESQ